jgi:hypothetical protein
MECSELANLLNQVKQTRKLDEYEKNALLAMDEAAADYVADIGITDLVQWPEEKRVGLWKHIWLVAGDSIRKQVADNDAPF